MDKKEEEILNNYREEDKPSKGIRNRNHKHKRNSLKEYTKLLKWEDTPKKHL